MATMQFCRNCNNLLYPKENKRERKLKYACRRCTYDEDAEDPCVYRHELVRTATTAFEKINPDIIKDPTLQRDPQATCERCEERDPEGRKFGVVFFQANEAMSADDKMTLIFVCCNPECLFKWQG